MWDFSIVLSITLLLRTIPFLFLKIGVWMIFAAVLVVAIWAGVWSISYLGDLQLLPRTALWLVLGALLGLAVAIWLIRWARSWTLYLVKAAHIAVLVELVQGRPLPAGRSQIGYGQSVVKERFGEASVLFLVDELVKSVLRAINRLAFGVLSFLPRKTGAQIAATIRTFLYFSFACMDELVLAHAIDNHSNDPWGSARDALALFGQNWTTILKNALWLTVFTLAILAPIFYYVVWPAWLAYQSASGPETLWPLITGALVMSLASAVLVGPFALVCLIQVWFRAISHDRPSPTWSARISEIAPELNQYRGARPRMPREYDRIRNGDLV